MVLIRGVTFNYIGPIYYMAFDLFIGLDLRNEFIGLNLAFSLESAGFIFIGLFLKRTS